MSTLSATHRALFNMDILDNVIVNIHDISHDALILPTKLLYPGPATLASVARVCKSFHDPALDKLWRDLPGFTSVFTLYNAVISSSVSLGHTSLLHYGSLSEYTE